MDKKGCKMAHRKYIYFVMFFMLLIAQPQSLSAKKIPDTGQTDCYNAAGDVSILVHLVFHLLITTAGIQMVVTAVVYASLTLWNINIRLFYICIENCLLKAGIFNITALFERQKELWHFLHHSYFCLTWLVQLSIYRYSDKYRISIIIDSFYL